MKKKHNIQYNLYIMLLFCTAVLYGSCQQPMKQARPSLEKPHIQKEKGKKKSGNSTKAQLEGLKISKRLSRTPAEPRTKIVSKEDGQASKPKLNHKGVPVKYIEKETVYHTEAAFEENMLLDPSNNTIYPGAILQGSRIDEGCYQEITGGKKRPAVISFNLQGVKDKNGNAGIVSKKIEPNLAAYRDLHNTILSQKVGYSASAYMHYEEMNIKSESDFDVAFNMGVGFSAAGIKTKIAAGFKFDNGANKNRRLIKFTETFYNVDVNQEDTPLITDIPKEELAGSMPVYVSSVSYGRIAYLSIVSDKTWKEIKPHIDAVLNPKLFKTDAEIKAALKILDETVDTAITIVGGSNDAVVTLEQFRKYIVSGGFSSGNPGQIIKFKLRFLDNSSAAHIKYTGEYHVRERVIVEGKGIAVTAQVKSIRWNNRSKGPAKVFGTIDMLPQHGSTLPKRLFDYEKNNALTIPYQQAAQIYPKGQTIILPTNSSILSFRFDIQGFQPAVISGEIQRIFRTDQNSKTNFPLCRTVNDLQRLKHIEFRLFDKKESINIAIEFTAVYVF